MILRPDAQVDYADDTAAVIRHDARNLPLDDATVDLIVTSPPYFALRSYRDDGEHYDGQLGSEATPQEFIDNLIDCMAEWVRVLKPSGSIFVNLGDKFSGSRMDGSRDQSGEIRDGRRDIGKAGVTDKRQPATTTIPPKSRMLLPHRFAIACEDRLGLTVRMDMIWAKPNGLPESVTDRVRASHEYWFHIVKEPRYFSGMDEIREAYRDVVFAANGHQQDKHSRTQLANTTGYDHTEHMDPNPLGRLPGSVWEIPSEPLIVPDEIRHTRNLPDHFAAFPQEWPRRLILGWSPTGVCSVCGEVRRPVVEKERVKPPAHSDGSITGNRNGGPDERQWDGLPRFDVSATITGYACACPQPDAPTTPAVILDPFGGTGTVAGVARTLGRFGISNDLSADYNRLAMWRIWESGHFTKTEQRTWADRQGSLL